MRKEVFTGKFYPSSVQELDKEIRRSFSGKLGPGDLPVSRRKGSVIGAIVPHAGYMFSGQCAAWAYKEIAEAEEPDCFVILSPNHSSYSDCFFSVSKEDFSTPFGIVENDQDFSEHLLEKFKIKEDREPHKKEHAIEVQLPFLQFASKKPPRIVPVIINQANFLELQQLAKAINEVAEQLKKKIAVIASSDFTHYGSAYGFTGDMDATDKKALSMIENGKAEEFFDFCHDRSICGFMAITILLCYAKIKKGRAKTLRYYTSADIIPDNNKVGYAAVIFRRKH